MIHRLPEPPAAQSRSILWDSVLVARATDGAPADAALAEVCRNHWDFLNALARRKGHTPEQAEDLTQGFLTDGLRRNLLRAVDPARGRFRNFLLTAFKNYLNNQYKREKRLKRVGRVATVSIDTGGAEARYLREPSHVETAERLYDRRWAFMVLDHALDLLEQRMRLQDNGPLFDRLKSTLLDAEGAVAYAQIAADLGKTEGAVRVAALRMRERLGKLIREEIGLTVADPSQVDDEIGELFAALSL